MNVLGAPRLPLEKLGITFPRRTGAPVYSRRSPMLRSAASDLTELGGQARQSAV